MAPKNYFLESTRQASFRAPRRPSVANGGSAIKWPHKNVLPPKRFVEAGFWFNPSPDHEDNVTCFLCNKSMEGWEHGDDPVAEHRRHCPDCGWALTVAIQETPYDEHNCDPHSYEFSQARLMTFGNGQWPHNNSKNLCAENMANAGFHYAPSKDAPDYCLCPFCHVSLANFEPEDDPRIEHHKRAPNCYFFLTEPKKQTKRAPRTSTVPKKQGTRRASRATSAAPEPPVELVHESNVVLDTERPIPKATRGKKATTKAAPAKKAVRKKAAVLDYAESIDSDGAKRGRKRSSSDISKEPVIMFDGGRDTTDEDENEIVVQPKKQRATRASISRQATVDMGIGLPKRQRTTRASIARQPKQDTYEMTLTDAEDLVPAKPKKGRRVVPKIKAAAVVITKTPSKHRSYMPTSDGFAHALELDSERPPSDEEDPAPHQTPFVRSTKKPTRSRTSLAVEQQMRDAPSDVLIPTASRHKGKQSARERSNSVAPPGTPLKTFFRDGDQDFSISVKVPKHLNRDIEVLDQNNESQSEDEEKQNPEPKKGRVKPRNAGPPEAEESKPKRAKITKKNSPAARSRSNTPRIEEPVYPKILPHRGNKPQFRDSAASLVSNIPDERQFETLMDQDEVEVRQEIHEDKIHEDKIHEEEIHEYEIHEDEIHEDEIHEDEVHEEAHEEEAHEEEAREEEAREEEAHEEEITDEEITDVDNYADAESVVDHHVDVPKTFDIHDDTFSREATVESPEEEPLTRVTRTSLRKSPFKKSPFKSSPAKAARGMDVMRDSPEINNDRHESIAPNSPLQEHTSALQETIENYGMDIDNIDDDQDDGPPEESSMQRDDSPKDNAHHNPSQLSDSQEEQFPEPSRAPLSPIRMQIMVPVESTPKVKKSRTLQSAQPWSPVDLDMVFAAHTATDDDQVGLSAAEREMTVEEWVKWNAANGERRLNETAERMVAIFEEKARRAIASIEGIATI